MQKVFPVDSAVSGQKMNLSALSRFILAMVLLVGVAGCRASDVPEARAGFLDLTGWSFVQNEAISLEGEWDFFPGQLFKPEDFLAGTGKVTPVFVDVPGPFIAEEGEAPLFGGSGYGTYRLLIKMDESSALALRMGDTWSAYRLWINGKLMLESGRPGRDSQSEKFRYGRYLVPDLPSDKRLAILIQVSNFHASSGGLLQAPELGLEESIVQSHHFEWAWRNFMLGGVAIMGFYHLMIFLFRRKERSHLLLGLYSWLWGINFTVTTSAVWMLLTIFPDAPLSLLRRVDHVTFYLSMPVNFYLVRSLFPSEFPLPIVKTAFAVFVIASIVSLMMPLHQAEILVVYMLVIIAPFLFIAFSAVCKAAINRLPGAQLAFAGYIVLTAMAVNDMLLIIRIVQTVEMVFIGIFFFMLLQSMAVSKRFSRAFSAVEQLSVQQERNLSIADELEKRRLSESEAKWNARFQQQEKLRFQFGPHFLFNALNSIRASILDTPMAARDMLTSLAELNRVAIANRTKTAVTVAEELEMTRLYLELEQARYGDYLSASFNVSTNVAHLEIPCFILQPLVENAIKYGRHTSPDKLEVMIELFPEANNLVVRVSNSGRWILPEEMDISPSTGFGLNHLKERLKFVGGTISHCEADNHVYVKISLPLALENSG